MSTIIGVTVGHCIGARVLSNLRMYTILPIPVYIITPVGSCRLVVNVTHFSAPATDSHFHSRLSCLNVSLFVYLCINFVVISAWFRGHACTPWPALLAQHPGASLSTISQTGKPFSHVSAYMKYRFICFCQSVILLLASRFASPSVIGSHDYTLYVQFGALQLSSYSMFRLRRLLQLDIVAVKTKMRLIVVMRLLLV